MNGYETEADYIRYLERLKRNREIQPWVSGTLMNNLLTVNLVRTEVTKFGNAQPEPNCRYHRKNRKKRNN